MCACEQHEQSKPQLTESHGCCRCLHLARLSLALGSLRCSLLSGMNLRLSTWARPIWLEHCQYTVMYQQI